MFKINLEVTFTNVKHSEKIVFHLTIYIRVSCKPAVNALTSREIACPNLPRYAHKFGPVVSLDVRALTTGLQLTQMYIVKCKTFFF
jgi:hypothetical protein